MPTFVKGGGTAVPFGRNEYLRSTNPRPRKESYMCAASTVTQGTDANGNRIKILQPGTVMAKITSGPDIGKVGPFQAGVTDGRQTAANIVGLNDTFLPWQLLERDVEIAVAYDTTEAVQAWCLEYDAGGNSVPLSNTTADAMRGNKKLDVHFS
jgi:hypothetical protein